MSCLPEKAETLTRCLYLLPVLRHLSALQRPNSSAGLPATLATDLGFKGGGEDFKTARRFIIREGKKGQGEAGQREGRAGGKSGRDRKRSVAEHELPISHWR